MADANVSVKFEGDDDKLVRTLGRLEDRLKAVTTDLRKVKKQGEASGRGIKKEFDRAGKSSKDAFGAKGLAQLKSFAIGMLSVGAAVAVVRKGFTFLAEERAKAMQTARTAADPRAALAQLAGGDVNKLRVFLAEAQRSQEQFGFAPGAAAGLQFQLQSLGLGATFGPRGRVAGFGQRELFGQLRGITNPAEVATGVGTLRAAFAGEGARPAQILNKLFAASAVSKTTIEQFAPAATIAAQTVQPIGGTTSELLGTLAVLSKAAKSAEVGGTQISALADIVGKKGFGGQGLLAGVQSIAQATAGLSNKEFIEFFGRKEARKGFQSIVGNLPEILATVRDVEQAGTPLSARARREGRRNLTERIIASQRAIPGIEAVRRLERQEQRTALAQEAAFALPELARRRAISRIGEMSVNDAAIIRAARAAGAATLGFFGAEAETIRDFDASMVFGLSPFMESAGIQLTRLEQAAIALERATRNLGGGPTLVAPDKDK